MGYFNNSMNSKKEKTQIFWRIKMVSAENKNKT